MEVEDIHIDQTIQRMIPGRNERAKKVQSDIIIFQKVEYSEFCFFEHEKPRLQLFGQNLDIHIFVEKQII